MAKMYVDVEALNLRSTPQVEPKNRIRFCTCARSCRRFRTPTKMAGAIRYFIQHWQSGFRPLSRSGEAVVVGGATTYPFRGISTGVDL
jgi:hypothetical protein